MQDNNIFKYNPNQNGITYLDKLERNNTVCIYPNPVEGYFSISNNEVSIDKLEIIDIAGNTYFTAKNNISEIISLSDLHSGIYLVTESS